jgi:CBS domain-containing protein
MKAPAKQADVKDLSYLINCNPLCAPADTTQDRIAEILCRSPQNKVYLTDDEGKLCGVIQARHLALKLLQLSPTECDFERQMPLLVFQLNAFRAMDLAVTPRTVQLTQSVENAMAAMADENVRDIAVVDRDGHLEGVLEAKTVLSHFFGKISDLMGA